MSDEYHFGVFDRFLRFLRFNKVKKYIPDNSVLCDLGCGQDAYLLDRLSDTIKYGIGFDEFITDSTRDNVSIKRYKFDNKIPLRDSSVDVVTMLASLEHFQNEKPILKEINRILKHGGIVLITVPTHYNKPLLEFLGKLGLLNNNLVKDHKRYYYARDIIHALWEAGFYADNMCVCYWQFGLNLFAAATKH